MMSQRKSLATCSGELAENLHRLDIELARELCQNICSLFGLVFIIPVDMFSSVKNLERQFILQLVETIFCLERENRKCDNVDLSYKNIDNLLKVTPESWLSSTYKFALEKCSQWLE